MKIFRISPGFYSNFKIFRQNNNFLEFSVKNLQSRKTVEFEASGTRTLLSVILTGILKQPGIGARSLILFGILRFLKTLLFFLSFTLGPIDLSLLFRPGKQRKICNKICFSLFFSHAFKKLSFFLLGRASLKHSNKKGKRLVGQFYLKT